MAKLANIKKAIEKKLDISDFVREFAESPEEKNWITIKKLTNLDKKKIELLSVDTIEGKKQTKLIEAMIKKGWDLNNLDEIEPKERQKLFLQLGLEGLDLKKINETTEQMQRVILESGIDPLKHSFVGEDDQPMELTYDFWNEYVSEDCLSFVIAQIKLFSKGFSLGESTAKE